MNQLGSEFGKGLEDKPAMVQSRMRQCEKLRVARLAIIKKKIEIDYARAFC